MELMVNVLHKIVLGDFCLLKEDKSRLVWRFGDKILKIQ